MHRYMNLRLCVLNTCNSCMKSYDSHRSHTTPCILLHSQVAFIPSILLRSRSTISPSMQMFTLTLRHVILVTVTEAQAMANVLSVLLLTRHSARHHAPTILHLQAIASTRWGKWGKSASGRYTAQNLGMHKYTQLIPGRENTTLDQAINMCKQGKCVMCGGHNHELPTSCPSAMGNHNRPGHCEGPHEEAQGGQRCRP
jgi:hypothetical protein